MQKLLVLVAFIVTVNAVIAFSPPANVMKGNYFACRSTLIPHLQPLAPHRGILCRRGEEEESPLRRDGLRSRWGRFKRRARETLSVSVTVFAILVVVFRQSGQASDLLGDPYYGKESEGGNRPGDFIMESVRPGVDSTTAESLVSGGQIDESENAQERSIDSSTVQVETIAERKSKRKAKARSSQRLYEGFEDEFEDEVLEDDQFIEKRDGAVKVNEVGLAREMRNYNKSTQEAKLNDILKVGAAFLSPLLTGLLIREVLRARREAAYVKKSIAILEAENAEYLNVTSTNSTNSTNSDIGDELKNMKNSTDTDDDDDDEPPRSPKRQ